MKYASGGEIKGSKDDSVLLVLSPSTYEISPEALKKYGPKLLDALNKMNCTVIIRGEDDEHET